MLPLSVFIITKNEEDRVPRAVKSAQFLTDDIIVVDSGSTDNTVKVAESLGARVTYHEWKGYGPQKCYAETLCKYDWLLNLDADEELSPELIEEIKTLFAAGEPKLSCYALDIRMVLPHEERPRTFAARNRVRRLYDRRHAGFKDSPVHDSVVLKKETEVPVLKQPVYHRSFRGLRHEIEKINYYSSMQAEDMIRHNHTPHVARIMIEPFAAFLKAYFFRRYFAYGVEGVTQSFIYAFARTLRLAKVWELQRKK